MTFRNDTILNRRTFIATSAAGLALAAGTGHARPAPHAGLIGCGEMGAALAQAATAQSLPLHLVAVADTDIRRLDALPRGVAGETSWETLVADPAIEVLLIATPDYLHGAMARAALESGKHVYLVPPFAHTGPETDALFQVARESGRLHVALNRHAIRHWTRYRDALSAGGGETPRWIQADIPLDANRPEGHWSHRRACGHGDGACALFSTLYPLMEVFGLGAPEQCTVLGGVFAHGGRETPDRLSLSATFEGGLRVTLNVREGGTAPQPTTVRGRQRLVEIAPYPAEADFDLADWARRIATGERHGSETLLAAKNAQGALCLAMEGG